MALKATTQNQTVFLDKSTTLNERTNTTALDYAVLVELAVMNAHLAVTSGTNFRPLYGVLGSLLSDVDGRILVTNL